MTTALVADRVKAAHAERHPLRIAGARTWLTAGAPVRSTDTVSLADDHGIVEYVPGDLTLTARAGTRLSEIADVARAEGQWLPLDPWGGDDGTVGATVATATAGPHAYALGLPRDVVLGMEFVNGTGKVINAGGRVVKNVAGFDLVRLMTGAWGTLGVITEMTLRLRARPELTRTLAIWIRSERAAIEALSARLRALPFVPLASEVVNAPLVALLDIGLPTQQMLLVQVGGNETDVKAQAALLQTLGECYDVDTAVWQKLRGTEPHGSASWRWSQLPSAFADTWAAAVKAAASLEDGYVHGNPFRGVVRVVVPPVAADPTSRLVRAATAFEGTTSMERLPHEAWSQARVKPAAHALAAGIRSTFDPAAILNRGIFGEEVA